MINLVQVITVEPGVRPAEAAPQTDGDKGLFNELLGMIMPEVAAQGGKAGADPALVGGAVETAAAGKKKEGAAQPDILAAAVAGAAMATVARNPEAQGDAGKTFITDGVNAGTGAGVARVDGSEGKSAGANAAKGTILQPEAADAAAVALAAQDPKEADVLTGPAAGQAAADKNPAASPAAGAVTETAAGAAAGAEGANGASFVQPVAAAGKGFVLPMEAVQAAVEEKTEMMAPGVEPAMVKAAGKPAGKQTSPLDAVEVTDTDEADGKAAVILPGRAGLATRTGDAVRPDPAQSSGPTAKDQEPLKDKASPGNSHAAARDAGTGVQAQGEVKIQNAREAQPALNIEAREEKPAAAKADAYSVKTDGIGPAVHVKELSSSASADRAQQPAAPRDEIINQVVAGIGRMVRRRDEGTVIKLNPPSLGRIRVELITRDHEVRASVVADSPAVRDVLLNNQSMLKASLQDAGLSLQEFSVMVDSGAGGGGTGPQDMHSGGGGRRDGGTVTHVEEEIKPGPVAGGIRDGLGLDLVI